VLKVADDSPAERAGILPGDIILEFDRHTIHTIKDLIALVQETPPGKRVKVVLWRNRTQKTVEVQIAASATEPPRPASTCQLVISGALDDHYNSNGNYDLSIAVNGQTLFNDTAQKVFEHGRPYGKRFDNWSTLPLDLPGDFKKGQKLSVQFKHSGSQKNDWIAVDSMELVCGSEKKRYEIGGYANYGARDGAAGIIYGQGSNGWTIQR
jgi:membrane-associated protease RseP (regulator of RpoE activity)